MKKIISSLLALILALTFFTGCCTIKVEVYPFSFEQAMDGWVATGLDLDSPSVEWSIERSQEQASDDLSSVKFYLNNMNDKGKIWMQRDFDLEPNRSYQVNLKYMFASSDFGSVNLWKIITGASPQAPAEIDDLIYQGNTANGADSDVGYVWLQKDYDLVAETDETGKLYITIGVWGTWESPRTYYVDNLEITFR